MVDISNFGQNYVDSNSGTRIVLTTSAQFLPVPAVGEAIQISDVANVIAGHVTAVSLDIAILVANNVTFRTFTHEIVVS